MKFTDTASLIKAPIIAVLLGLVAYLLIPFIEPAYLGSTGIISATALGALVGILLAALKLNGGTSHSTESGKNSSIFVGNLAFKTSQQELRELFQAYGTVHSVRIMTDRVTRRPRGYGFIEMDSRASAKAIRALNGKDFLGRKLRVNEGNERRPKEGEGEGDLETLA